MSPEQNDHYSGDNIVKCNSFNEMFCNSIKILMKFVPYGRQQDDIGSVSDLAGAEQATNRPLVDDDQFTNLLNLKRMKNILALTKGITV